MYHKRSIKRPVRLFNFRTKRRGGGGCLVYTRRLLEGGVYFLSKVTHSNHYRNRLTALLNSNNFHTTFEVNNKLLIDEVVYMLFIIGKTLSVSEKIIPGIYVINAPPLPPLPQGGVY